jgi:hypothetical protein
MRAAFRPPRSPREHPQCLRPHPTRQSEDRCGPVTSGGDLLLPRSAPWSRLPRATDAPTTCRQPSQARSQTPCLRPYRSDPDAVACSFHFLEPHLAKCSRSAFHEPPRSENPGASAIAKPPGCQGLGLTAILQPRGFKNFAATARWRACRRRKRARTYFLGPRGSAKRARAWMRGPPGFAERARAWISEAPPHASSGRTVMAEPGAEKTESAGWQPSQPPADGQTESSENGSCEVTRGAAWFRGRPRSAERERKGSSRLRAAGRRR